MLRIPRLRRTPPHVRAGFSLYLIFCIRWRIIKKDGAELNILSQLADKVSQPVHIFRQGSGQMLHSRCRVVKMYDDVIWGILRGARTAPG